MCPSRGSRLCAVPSRFLQSEAALPPRTLARPVRWCACWFLLCLVLQPLPGQVGKRRPSVPVLPSGDALPSGGSGRPPVCFPRQLASSASLEGKGQLKFTSGRWSPHHNCTQVATANDTAVRGWDTRTMRSVVGGPGRCVSSLPPRAPPGGASGARGSSVSISSGFSSPPRAALTAAACRRSVGCSVLQAGLPPAPPFTGVRDRPLCPAHSGLREQGPRVGVVVPRLRVGVVCDRFCA